MKPQAISGVSAAVESEIETVYPSIAASGFGRLLGRVMNAFPGSVNGVRISHLLFAPFVAPLALLGYLSFKVTGRKYLLTNRTVQIRSSLGNNLQQQASLADVENVAVTVAVGQEFYHAADLELLDAREETLMVLHGVPHPQRFRQIILDARDARRQNDAALKTIQSRG